MSKLKIAIQKSGRLNRGSLDLLRDCGLRINNGKDRLKVSVPDFPLEIVYLRNSDIPQYLEDGIVDIAVLGENTLIEKQKDVKLIRSLGFAKCRLSLAIPKNETASDLSYFEGKKIATSYPNILGNYLLANNIKAGIHTISGSVEIAPNIGLAEAVCDIVSTGSTLFQNGLKEVKTILKSEAVLVRSNKITIEKEAILQKLLFRIDAVLRADQCKYILMNVPDRQINAVTECLPVLKSPTVLPLAEKGWSSLHSVINEREFWNVIDDLKEAGAEDILVIPIDKMVI